MAPHVRVAALDDVPAAAEVLADAFADYPWTRWTVDADGHGERLRALHRLYLTAVGIPFGHVDVAEIGHQLVGVAVWVPSTGIPDEVWTHVGPAAAELAGHRATAAAEAEVRLAERRPGEPHLTLASLGVARHRHGKGLGAALLVAGLRRVDESGLPVWLETSAEPNVRLYRRLGFAVVDVVDLPGDGPRTWLMLREPARTGTERAATGAGPEDIWQERVR